MKLYAVALAALLPCLAATLGDVDKSKSIGNASAPVRLDLYSDFQCPACKGFHETLLSTVIKDYVVPGRAYLVFHEFPLPMHNHSREAANYATAAAAVGKYQQVGDSLFKAQASWTASGNVWAAVAAVLTPVEQAKVQALAKDPAVLAQIQQDLDAGKRANVNQTPTLVVSRAGRKSYTFGGPDPTNYPLLKALIDGLAK